MDTYDSMADRFKTNCDIAEVVVEHYQPFRIHWVQVGELHLPSPMRSRVYRMATRLLISRRLGYTTE